MGHLDKRTPQKFWFSLDNYRLKNGKEVENFSDIPRYIKVDKKKPNVIIYVAPNAGRRQTLLASLDEMSKAYRDEGADEWRKVLPMTTIIRYKSEIIEYNLRIPTSVIEKLDNEKFFLPGNYGKTTQQINQLWPDRKVVSKLVSEQDGDELKKEEPEYKGPLEDGEKVKNTNYNIITHNTYYTIEKPVADGKRVRIVEERDYIEELDQSEMDLGDVAQAVGLPRAPKGSPPYLVILVPILGMGLLLGMKMIEKI